jgi:hypothetical protein
LRDYLEVACRQQPLAASLDGGAVSGGAGAAGVATLARSMSLGARLVWAHRALNSRLIVGGRVGAGSVAHFADITILYGKNTEFDASGT